MTELTTAQRPQLINTVERHLAYDILLLARLNPDLQIIEQAGTLSKVVEAVISPANDGSIRLIARVSLPLDPNYANDITQPLYMQIQDVSNVAVPDDWKQEGT